MANNYTQATLTPSVRLTDELRTALEITLASLEPDDNGTWSVCWDQGIGQLADADAQDLPQSWDADRVAAFQAKWSGKDLPDILRAILAENVAVELLTVEGAHTCSKMRAGQFGGFGLYVTRHQFAFVSSTDALLQDGRLVITAAVQDWQGSPGGEGDDDGTT
jgi:hypothetical protein